MKLRITLSTFCAVFIAALIVTLSVTMAALPRLTQYNYDMNSGKAAYTIEKILEIDERIDEINVGMPELSFCAEAGDEVIRGQNVSIVLVNEMFFKNYDINCGEFNENSTVISKQLARELFFNESPIGETLETKSRFYNISGVYDDKSDDGKNRIYVDYRSVKGSEKLKVTEFAAKSGSISALGLGQMKPEAYFAVDFSEKRRVIADFGEILKLIAFIVLCLAALRIRKLIVNKEKAKVDDSLCRDYRLKSILHSPTAYGGYLLALVGIPAALIAVFILMSLNIYIIPAYIPLDNIFDIPCYFEQAGKAAQSLNAAALAGNSSLIRLYQAGFWTLVFEAVGVTVMTALTYLGWRTVRK